jgi:hypothetical protein
MTRRTRIRDLVALLAIPLLLGTAWTHLDLHSRQLSHGLPSPRPTLRS